MASKYLFSTKEHLDFYNYPEKYYVKPFRIIGKIWFVGNADVGAYLIDTEKGLVLIDTTYPTTRAQMIQSIWEAGFNPRDIRHIIHTHGHFDHIGATSFLVSLSGAKTYLGEGDALMFKQRPELMLGSDAGPAFIEVFEPDVILRDGDILDFGDVRIRCVSTPGHTMGVFTFFIETSEGDKKYTAALCGGIGLNTICKEFIEQYNVPEYRSNFENSMNKIINEPVDVVLGNHTPQNDTLGKYERWSKNPNGENPFVNKNEWKDFIGKAISNYKQMLIDEER